MIMIIIRKKLSHPEHSLICLNLGLKHCEYAKTTGIPGILNGNN